MRSHALLLIETGMTIAALCMFFWWPWALDLIAWHTQSPVRGICWFLSLLYFAVIFCAPIKINGTSFDNLF